MRRKSSHYFFNMRVGENSFCKTVNPTDPTTGNCVITVHDSYGLRACTFILAVTPFFISGSYQRWFTAPTNRERYRLGRKANIGKTYDPRYDTNKRKSKGSAKYNSYLRRSTGMTWIFYFNILILLESQPMIQRKDMIGDRSVIPLLFG